MKNKTITLYTYASKYSFENDFSINTSTYLRESDFDQVIVPISEIEVTIPIPEVTQEQLVNGEIEQLKSNIKAEQERAYKKVKFWEDRISKLQAIESK